MRTLNQRSDMRELRAAIDKEVADGIAVYDARVAQDACVEARLDKLARWLRRGWRWLSSMAPQPWTMPA